VNADTNEDIDGALNCVPISRCFSLADNFNIRSRTFGNVDSVAVGLSGPVNGAQTGSATPFTVFGDAKGKKSIKSLHER